MNTKRLAIRFNPMSSGFVLCTLLHMSIEYYNVIEEENEPQSKCGQCIEFTIYCVNYLWYGDAFNAINIQRNEIVILFASL